MKTFQDFVHNFFFYEGNIIWVAFAFPFSKGYYEITLWLCLMSKCFLSLLLLSLINNIQCTRLFGVSSSVMGELFCIVNNTELISVPQALFCD